MVTTLRDPQAQLGALHQKLEAANVDDMQRVDLEILEKQLEMQIIVGSFDPLKALDGLDGVDVSKVKGLIQQVDQVIQNEAERTKMVGQIITILKTALKAAGLPLS